MNCFRKQTVHSKTAKHTFERFLTQNTYFRGFKQYFVISNLTTVHDGEKPVKCMFWGFKMHTLQFSKTVHDGEKPV